MDTLTPAERLIRMSLVRGEDRGPELIVCRRLIRGMGYGCRKHAPSVKQAPRRWHARRAARRWVVAWECELHDLPAVADRLKFFLDA